jgi:hypothetical protein
MADVFKILFGLPIFIVKLLKMLILMIPKIVVAFVKFVIIFVTKIIPLIISGILNSGVFLETFMYYLTNPTELFSFFISVILFIPIMFITILYHIPIADNLMFGDFFMYMLIFPLYTVSMIFSTVFYWIPIRLVIEYWIFGYLDIEVLKGSISSFYYRYLIACENPPNSWYMAPGFHLDNKNIKRIFAYNRCPQGFKPNGMFCEKMPYFEPAYCTMAHIYRKYEDIEAQFNGLYFPGNFKYTNEFLKKSAYKQADEIEDYKKKVAQHHTQCESAHMSKDTLVKSVCKSLIGDDNADIKGLCQKQYCAHSNEAFCHLLTNSSIENTTVVSGNLLAMMRIIVFILILIITSVFFNKRNVL